MATDFSNHMNLVNKFNEKYGLKFSFENFERAARKNGNDAQYTSAFSGAYIDALTNFADRKRDSFNSIEFIRDYQNMMEDYKAAVNNNGVKVEEWPDTADLVYDLNIRLNDREHGIPDNKRDYIIQRYEAGKLPLREMRAYAQSLMDKDCKDPEQLSVVWGYHKALQELNDKRSRLWRIMHPFRNNAEKRDAKAFRKMVAKQIGIFKESSKPLPKEEMRPILDAASLSSGMTEKFLMTRNIAEDLVLQDAKNLIGNIMDEYYRDQNVPGYEGPQARMDFSKKPQPARANIVNKQPAPAQNRGEIGEEPYNIIADDNVSVASNNGDLLIDEQTKQEAPKEEAPKQEEAPANNNNIIAEEPIKEEVKQPVIREKSQNELQTEQSLADPQVKADMMAKFNEVTSDATMEPMFAGSAMKPTERMKSTMKNMTLDIFYKDAGEFIGKMWEATDSKNPAAVKAAMAEQANNIFYRAESAMSKFGLPDRERFVAAQQMTDMMINRFSPVAFDKNLATYGDMYFLNHTSLDEIGTLAKTDDFGEQRKILTGAKNIIIRSREHLDLSKEFDNNKEDVKAPKIDGRNAPDKNRIKE